MHSRSAAKANAGRATQRQGTCTARALDAGAQQPLLLLLPLLQRLLKESEVESNEVKRANAA
jgi:hypothetical protein